MKYTFERVHDLFDAFWVIYENSDELVQRTIFCSRFYEEAMKKWKELHEE